MSDIHPMKKPWSVVGAGFNDEGVYFTFDDTVIHRSDINLMQAAPELLEALRQLRDYVEDVLAVSTEDCDQQHPLMLATSVISKALGQ